MLNVDAIGNAAALAPKTSVQGTDGEKGAFAKEMQGAVQRQTAQKPHKTQNDSPARSAESSDPHDAADETQDAQSPIDPNLAAMAAASQTPADPQATPNAPSLADEQILSAVQGTAAGSADAMLQMQGDAAAAPAVVVPGTDLAQASAPMVDLPAQAGQAAQGANPGAQADKTPSAAPVDSFAAAMAQVDVTAAGQEETRAQTIASIPSAQNAAVQSSSADAQPTVAANVQADGKDAAQLAAAADVQSAQKTQDAQDAQNASAQPLPAQWAETVQDVTLEPAATKGAQDGSPDAAAQPQAAQTTSIAPPQTAQTANTDAQGGGQGEQDAKVETAQNKNEPVAKAAGSEEPEFSQLVDVRVAAQPDGDHQAPQVKQAVTAAVAEQIDALVQAEKNQVKIQLKPDVLGGMTIRLSMEQSGLKVHLLTNGSEAHALVNDQIGQLKEALRERGITVTQMEIVDQGAAQTSQQPSYARDQQQPGRYRRQNAYAVRTEAPVEAGALYASMIRVENPLGSMEFSA